MHRRSVLAGLALLPLAATATTSTAQGAGGFRFDSIDGGQYDTGTWHGRPVLVVNTASLCGYTSQYDDLQALHDAYAERGLVVLAVPSNDFSQELGSEEEVAEFCEVNFNLTLPMTTITSVRGRDAHPFYTWLRETEGFVPRWNFNKVLLDGEGRVVESYGSNANPMGRRIRNRIEALLPA